MQHTLSFKTLISNLVQQINTLTHSYKINYVNHAIWESYYKTQLSQWFTKNWSDLKCYAKSLVTNKTKYINIIATMQISAYTADNENNNMKKSAAFKLMLDNLANALNELKLNELSNLFKSSYTALINYVEDNNPNIEDEVKAPKQQTAKHTQFNQAEVLIQDVINALPKKHQHNARQIVINNANNKLQALMQFIKQNKLQ